MAGSNPVSALLIVIITILRKFHASHRASNEECSRVLSACANLVPPVGVFMIAGCGADLLVNICLTVLGSAH